jgi:hypothetical protein
MTAHPLAGTFSVESSARRVRHYRYAEERMMRTLGGWMALTPELPVKVLFGRHVWDCAQHADLWGRRLPELRAPAQQSEPANDRFVRFMDQLDAREAVGESLERVVGVYRVLKPHLLATYRAHLASANQVYEPPTRRILERCIAEEERHIVAGAVVLERLLADTPRRQRAAAWEGALCEALAEAGGVAGDDPAARRSFASEGVDPTRDIVALESRFDAGVVDASLRTAIERHVNALGEGDAAGLAEGIAEPERAAVLLACGRPGPGQPFEIVAQAKVGRSRFIKLRLRDAEGSWLVVERWEQVDDRWRVVEAERLAAPPGS